MHAKEWDNIAENYFENLSSPFEKDVSNPIYSIVKNMRATSSLKAIDLGTGVGNLIPFLEKNFKEIFAVDFSDKMIKIAEKKKKTEKVKLIKKDMKNLKCFHSKFDVAFAVNSFLAPSIKDISKMLQEAKNVLKNKGKLIAVFPSLESVLYKAMLTYEHERKNKGKEKARKATKERIEKDKYDFMLGFMDEEGKQKHFYKFEIEYRLNQAGFRNIKFDKVEYPWENFCERYYLKFKNKKKMWDWIVTAEK